MEKRVYFKNLAALRFFAASAVIFHHVEQYKAWAKLPNVWGNVVIDGLGHKAVSLFFVLSGFLITYLLLAENKKTSTISIKDFYVRRILRIWPLYYLIVCLSLFVVPFVFDLRALGMTPFDGNFIYKIILLLLVLPNVVRLFSPTIVGANQLWSIGVEEQFYLIWPLLVKKFIRKFPFFLLIFVLIKFIITLLLQIWAIQTDASIAKVLYRFWVLLQIEQMSIGAFGAWALFHHKERILKVFYHPASLAVTLAGITVLFVVPIHYWIVSYLEAFFFLSLILNLSTHPKIVFSLETPLLNTMGNISYGIYMYHTLCITIALYALRALNVDKGDGVVFNIILYTLSVLLTYVVSYVSYEYFEKAFLNLKEKFMIVKSGSGKS
jgi:peptidoglycan/LPS O-acetylase OafA/YrhL